MKVRILAYICIFSLYVSLGSYSVLHKITCMKKFKSMQKYEIAPQNAMIDKIWKATPGYNGRQVDIEASYNNMKKLKEFDQKYLEFKEVSPSVHLEDLSPAPIYRGHPNKKMVGLTINVAWGNEYLPRILEILKSMM